MDTKIPKKITPCPIHEAVVGLSFETEIDPGAVFGIIYNEFKGQYKTVKKLPILNIPEEMRVKDNALKNQAWYQLIDKNVTIAIGPTMLGISNQKEYLGWDEFSQRTFDVIEKIQGLKIIKKVSRVGIRYINFFKFDIYEKIDVELRIRNEKLESDQLIINAKINKGEFTNTLQVLNRAGIKSEDKMLTGSVIDIDTHSHNDLDGFFGDYKERLNRGHEVEKELFFSLLREDFLKELRPEY